jgi:TPR repeat protein
MAADEIVYNPNLSAEELFQRARRTYNEHASNYDSMKDLRAAAEKGHGQAQYTLGIMCYASLKFKEAAQWFEKSVAQEHPKQKDAQEFLVSIRDNLI